MPDPIPPADPNPPRQKSAIAEEHLARVGRGGSTTLFRLIMDDPERKGSDKSPPIELVGTFGKHEKELRLRNDMGYAIFYQVNEADGKGYKAGNIVAASCFFADFDGTPLENVGRLGLAPHVEIETSPGKRHYYWRVDGIPIADWKSVQQRLIALFDSDRSIHDLPRIMRLSGFLHQKNSAAPHLVNIAASRNAPPYTYDAFMAALAAAEQAAGIAAEKPRRKLPASIAPPDERKRAADLQRAESALRHLIASGSIDLGDRADWINVGIALRASYEEDGFPLYVKLASEAAGFEGDEDCRKQWETFKDDRPDDKRLTIATFVAKAKEAGWAPEPGGDGDGGNGRGGRGRTDAAVTVLDQAEDAGDEFWVDTVGRAFVTFGLEQRGGGKRRVSERVNSELYRGEIAERFLAETGKKVLPREQANIAVELIEHRARTRGEVREAAVRVAGREGAVYVDLSRADGKIVRIDAAGYTIVAESPIAFVRGRGGELPLPEEGGSLADFERHLNLSPIDRLQTVGFAIAMFNPVGPYPILLCEGPYGTAKTSLLDKLMALGDPPADPLDTHMAPPRSERDLQIEASGVRVVGQDNLSHMTDDQANWWCRLATGGSTSVRKNYSDEDQIRHRAMRPAIITCIGTPSRSGDFLDRCLRVTTLPIANPLPDEMVRAAFLADRPRMLGFLFRCVSAALQNAPALAAAAAAGELRLPRMAAFALFIEGAAELLGLERGQFSALLRDGQATMQAESALGDPVGAAIVRYFSDDGSHSGAGGRVLGGDGKRNVLEGSATEVLTVLRGYDPDSRDWPPTNMLKDRLRRIGPGLRDLGVDWEFRAAKGHINKSSYVLTRTAAFVPTGEARRS